MITHKVAPNESEVVILARCKECYYYNGEVCINHCDFVIYPLITVIDSYGKTFDYLDSFYARCLGYRPDFPFLKEQ